MNASVIRENKKNKTNSSLWTVILELQTNTVLLPTRPHARLRLVLPCRRLRCRAVRPHLVFPGSRESWRCLELGELIITGEEYICPVTASRQRGSGESPALWCSAVWPRPGGGLALALALAVSACSRGSLQSLYLPSAGSPASPAGPSISHKLERDAAS